MRPWLILDRDGVINRDRDDFVRRVRDWQPLPGSIGAIADLHRAGWPIAVATNQSGIGRGLFSRSTVDGMHRKLRRLVREAGGDIDAITLCPHAPDAGCTCRKPLPGMLHRLARRLGLEVGDAVMVGDAERDLAAGAAAGTALWLVRTGKGSATEQRLTERPPTWWSRVQVADDLAGVAGRLLGDRHG